jgi:hypothetical protein
MAAVRTIKPRKIKRPGYRQDPSWADVQEHFSGPLPPVDHAKTLKETAWLTKTQLAMWVEGFVDVNPKELIRVLNRAGVKFVLMGAHVTNAWARVEARATRDVDVLVQKSHHKKAVAAVQKAFPTLRVEEHPVVTRFRDPADNLVAIDVMKPSHELHKAVMKHTVRVEGHDVPTLEMLLACKFAAMTSPNRANDRKLIDGADFMRVVKHNKDDIRRERLREFGELVFRGGGNHLVKLVDDVLAGRMLVF